MYSLRLHLFLTEDLEYTGDLSIGVVLSISEPVRFSCFTGFEDAGTYTYLRLPDFLLSAELMILLLSSDAFKVSSFAAF